MNKTRPFHLLLKELDKATFLEFSRFPQWQEDQLRCDCAGLITLFLKDQGKFPTDLGERPKACQYFEWLNESPLKKTTIHQLDRYDILMWKKSNPPQSGDTGHLLLLLSRPKKVNDTTYTIKILEVNRFDGLTKRPISLKTFKDGRLKGVAWHPSNKKVKETIIIGADLFKREECPTCSFIHELCQCKLMPKVKPKAPPIHILRHPSEKKHPLASVKILETYFDNLHVEDGEVFSPRPGVLLYSDTIDKNSEQDPQEYPLLTSDHPLIIIDATWKKSHRLLQLNPWLLELPRLALSGHESQYFLRRQRSRDHLSSLESFCYSLKNFGETVHQEYSENLLTIFQDFIKKRKDFYGEELLQEFYHERDNGE